MFDLSFINLFLNSGNFWITICCFIPIAVMLFAGLCLFTIAVLDAIVQRR